MVSIDEYTPPPGALWKELDEAAVEGFITKLKSK
jgi:hypothetical protein